MDVNLCHNKFRHNGKIMHISNFKPEDRTNNSHRNIKKIKYTSMSNGPLGFMNKRNGQYKWPAGLKTWYPKINIKLIVIIILINVYLTIKYRIYIL